MITIESILLAIIAVLLAGRIWQAHQQHAALVRWLDALGDMTGDLLRSIIECLKGDESGNGERSPHERNSK